MTYFRKEETPKTYSYLSHLPSKQLRASVANCEFVANGKMYLMTDEKLFSLH